MEQQSPSDSQESIQFGEVDLSTEQHVLNDSQDNSQPLIEEETSSINRTQQQQPTIVNFGPCVVCKINECCIFFVGCNHLACCGQCLTACNNICPVLNCNRSFIEHLRVFKP